MLTSGRLIARVLCAAALSDGCHRGSLLATFPAPADDLCRAKTLFAAASGPGLDAPNTNGLLFADVVMAFFNKGFGAFTAGIVGFLAADTVLLRAAPLLTAVCSIGAILMTLPAAATEVRTELPVTADRRILTLELTAGLDANDLPGKDK